MLDELEADSNELAARLQADAARRLVWKGGQSPALNWDGRFGCPARGPITSGFGYRMHPILGYRKFHSGLDIGAGFGAPVYAAANGEILEAGFYRGYGRCIIISHGGGLPRSTVISPPPASGRDNLCPGGRISETSAYRPRYRAAPSLRGAPGRGPGKPGPLDKPLSGTYRFTRRAPWASPPNSSVFTAADSP